MGTNEVISIAGRLPLHSGARTNYASKFGRLHSMHDQERILANWARLEGKRKLALIVACIWAKAQMGQQGEPLVKDAARAALEIVDAEELTLNRDALLEVMREQERNIDVSGGYMPVLTTAADHAEIATTVLSRLRL
ncbi:hypothetical protein [Ktedonospora formicarum]|uniref:Uncharacterized protein n=1 Tax=Ktedonospora formicarum TaxID=2778364 RepID=A0A8J3I2J7_9CHLR|nr:hypothetical protein [Ktedonospora formicarum]GHO48149.1 hypothetical protein KSX_63120 [Ktedonospora formicarum]